MSQWQINNFFVKSKYEFSNHEFKVLQNVFKIIKKNAEMFFKVMNKN